jgi:hypothetical protein
MEIEMHEQIEGISPLDGSSRTYQAGSGMGLLEQMGAGGDTKTIWDRNNPTEVAAARKTYDDLTAKRYRAYHVTGEDGEKGEPMDEFDPDCERMILVPQYQGG